MQQYKTQSVNTMTTGEMLILLYDELPKRLKKCKIFLEQAEFAVFEKEAERCREIVLYLRNSLDRRYPISGNLEQMYEYFTYELIRLTAGRKTKIIDDLIPLVEELRDTFRQADRLARKEG